MIHSWFVVVATLFVIGVSAVVVEGGWVMGGAKGCRGKLTRSSKNRLKSVQAGETLTVAFQLPYSDAFGHASHPILDDQENGESTAMDTHDFYVVFEQVDKPGERSSFPVQTMRHSPNAATFGRRSRYAEFAVVLPVGENTSLGMLQILPGRYRVWIQRGADLQVPRTERLVCWNSDVRPSWFTLRVMHADPSEPIPTYTSQQGNIMPVEIRRRSDMSPDREGEYMLVVRRHGWFGMRKPVYAHIFKWTSRLEKLPGITYPVRVDENPKQVPVPIDGWPSGTYSLAVYRQNLNAAISVSRSFRVQQVKPQRGESKAKGVAKVNGKQVRKEWKEFTRL